MSNKKRNQILAALLCATTMAAFYGSPKAEAAVTGNAIYDSDSGVLQVEGIPTQVTNLNLAGGTIETTGTLKGGSLSLGNATLSESQLGNITNVIQEDAGDTSITADKATIGGSTITSTGITTNGVTMGDMTIADGVITRNDGVKINGVELKGDKVTAANGFTVNENNYLNDAGLKASAATISGDIEGVNITATGTLKGNSLEITGQSLTLNGKELTAAKIDHINNTVIGNQEVDASKGLTLGNTLVKTTGNIEGDTIKATEYTIDGGNSWTSAQLKAGTAVIGGNTTINSDGIATNKVTLDHMTITETGITNSNGFAINSVNLVNGTVTAAGGFTVDVANSLDKNGLKASAATISGDATVDGTFSAGKGNFIANASGTTTTGTATFTKDGSTTTISGGTITADTLKVDKIELGSTGAPSIIIGTDGAFSAAGGQFTIAGEGGDKGAITNKVGGTEFSTTTGGITSKASDDFNTSTSTITSTGITNESGAASSTITGGSNANITNTVGESATTKSVMTENSITNTVGNTTTSVMNKDSITDTVGDTTVTTTTGGMEIAGTGINEGNGMKVDTATGTVTFTNKDSKPVVEGGVTETTIKGNTITTGQITTDKLVITGNGQADDKGAGGSIAMGGDGSIVSNIKDGNNETKFQTTVEGITGTVTDDTNTTNTSTKATGTTIKVVDGTNEANSNVSADKIENSVNSNAVTIGTDGITSKVGDNVKTEMTTGGITSTVDSTSQTIGTSSVTTKVGDYQSKLNADGMTITDGNIDNSTNITSGDVSIKTKDYDISLSQMGQIKEIDGELQGRGEYEGTVVSGLNAEAAIRREEVARLDNRIDQTNERLDRVGAMAAAAASLKSMGYDPAAPTEFAMGVGTYKGSQAIAVGLFHYPNRDFMLNINYTQSAGEKMGGVGATWKFGRKNPDKVLDDQLKERQKKVKIAQEKAAAAAQLAKEADERAAYAARQAQHAKTQAATAYRDAEKAYLERESK